MLASRLSSTSQNVAFRRGFNAPSRNFSQSATLRMEVVSPANGSTVANLKESDKKSIQVAFDQAKAAQKSWAKVPLEKKKQIIEKFGSILSQRTEELAKILSSETGKPVSQATNEIKGVLPRIKFFNDNVEQVIKPRPARATDAFTEEVRHEPLGVIANISAWNYPYFVGSNVFVPALLTGNAILYKPSEYSSLTGTEITNMLHSAGVPKEIFSLVIGRGDVGEALLNTPINGVFFTGSHSTGHQIARKVGEKMIRVQLELGGKDPTYVSNNVDVAKAAAALADGAFYNTGQSCCSVERIYVHQDVYENFVENFVKEVKNFQIGDPTLPATYIGPLTLSKQVKVLEEQVKDAVAKGAKILAGGKKMAGKPGNWFEPTVLVNVNHTMEVMMEESFGPIIGIQKVSSAQEAVQLMNDCKYGLTSGIYSKSREEAEEILSQINSGTVYWNACDRVSPWLPWSGRNGSGMGATLGVEGIQAFVQPKAWHMIKP